MNFSFASLKDDSLVLFVWCDLGFLILGVHLIGFNIFFKDLSTSKRNSATPTLN
jgi:hypothetical protein